MNELEWLNDQRPEVAAPDEETTAHARAALLAHSAVAPPQRSPRLEPRRSGRAGLYAVAAFVFAIAIVVVAGALPSGDDGPARQLAKKIGAPTAAEAAPLVKLSKRIAAQPAPTGDATLVQRVQHYPKGDSTTGNDLYFDDGRYYYGATSEELKQSTDLGEGVPKLERDAALAANTKPADQARRMMIDATWGPKGEPSKTVQTAQMKAIIKAKSPKGGAPKPASQQTQDDNRVWIGSMDTLIAGAGDPEVRAGVMTLLSTLTKVHVVDHGATLEITNTDFPDGYQEALTVDAETGVLEKEVGGVPGQTPEVVVTYDIKRVTGADVLSD
jgi:hypothetical protein